MVTLTVTRETDGLFIRTYRVVAASPVGQVAATGLSARKAVKFVEASMRQLVLSETPFKLIAENADAVIRVARQG